MTHITRELSTVLLKHSGIVVRLRGLDCSNVAYVEDSIRQIFQAAHVPHKVRDYVALDYPVSSKLYLGLDRGILTIEAECGESAEFLVAVTPFKKLLDAAGVPYVSD